jgi:hypothetical protein
MFSLQILQKLMLFQNGFFAPAIGAIELSYNTGYNVLGHVFSAVRVTFKRFFEANVKDAIFI